MDRRADAPHLNEICTVSICCSEQLAMKISILSSCTASSNRESKLGAQRTSYQQCRDSLSARPTQPAWIQVISRKLSKPNMTTCQHNLSSIFTVEELAPSGGSRIGSHKAVRFGNDL